MTISRELWVRNLVGIAKDLADSEHQQSRWLAADSAAWERPCELLCVVVDDCQLELFVKEQGPSLSKEQLDAATALLQQSLAYDVGPTGWRDPKEVLSDPAWERLRQAARSFEDAFNEKS
jgi:hypothetical protein